MHKAFTLIELLVVVAIIGILAAVGVTTFGGFQEKAKISVLKSRHASIQKDIIFFLTLTLRKTLQYRISCAHKSFHTTKVTYILE